MATFLGTNAVIVTRVHCIWNLSKMGFFERKDFTPKGIFHFDVDVLKFVSIILQEQDQRKHGIQDHQVYPNGHEAVGASPGRRYNHCWTCLCKQLIEVSVLCLSICLSILQYSHQLWHSGLFPFDMAYTFSQTRPQTIWYNFIIMTFIYSQTSMARTSLGPWNFVRDMGSSSHWVNHGARSGSKWR